MHTVVTCSLEIMNKIRLIVVNGYIGHHYATYGVFKTIFVMPTCFTIIKVKIKKKNSSNIYIIVLYLYYCSKYERKSCLKLIVTHPVYLDECMD